MAKYKYIIDKLSITVAAVAATVAASGTWNLDVSVDVSLTSNGAVPAIPEELLEIIDLE